MKIWLTILGGIDGHRGSASRAVTGGTGAAHSDAPCNGGTPPGRAGDDGEPTTRPGAATSRAKGQEAVADVAGAGRPSVDTATGWRGDTGRSSCGGHARRPRNAADFERQDRWANEAYDHIRENPDANVIAAHLREVQRLDGSTGFSVEEVDRIRDHVFFRVHHLAGHDGGTVHRRYDASPDMAEAWLRLRSGLVQPEDIALLEHESVEARYYDTHPDATYEEAHRAANKVVNWQNQIPAPTYEDYSRPWR